MGPGAAVAAAVAVGAGAVAGLGNSPAAAGSFPGGLRVSQSKSSGTRKPPAPGSGVGRGGATGGDTHILPAPSFHLLLELTT